MKLPVQNQDWQAHPVQTRMLEGAAVRGLCLRVCVLRCVVKWGSLIKRAICIHCPGTRQRKGGEIGIDKAEGKLWVILGPVLEDISCVLWRCETACSPSLINVFVVFALSAIDHHPSFTLVELGFTWGQGVLDNALLSPSYRYLNYNQHGPPQRAARVHTKHTHVTPLSAVAVRAETQPGLINTDSWGEVFPWLTVIDSAIWWFVSALRHNWLAIRKLRRRYWITIQKDWVSVSIGFHISSISLPLSVFLSSEYISHFQ